MDKIINQIRQDLKSNADDKTRESGERFFKEEVKLYGIKSAAVSLIVPARKGKFLKEIFRTADMLFTDKDDMVQKGYGWMLKSASQAHQKQVFDYVFSKKATMPKTALRYAIEKMPEELKAMAMKK